MIGGPFFLWYSCAKLVALIALSFVVFSLMPRERKTTAAAPRRIVLACRPRPSRRCSSVGGRNRQVIR